MAEGKPGIVVLGSPRSGTTLLRRLLDAHPSIACPPETYLLSAAARFLHADQFAAGLRIGVVDGLAFAGFEEAEVLGRLRSMTFGFLRDYAERAGKPRWAEKTAFDAFHLAGIRRLCEGHVKFVCIQRHGLDVVASLRDLVDKTGGYVEELHAYVRRYPEPLEAMARAWIDTATAIAELAESSEHAISLRYEDLSADPQAQMQRVFEFLDEPWDDELVGRALAGTGQVGFGDWKTYARASVDRSSVDRWKALPAPVQDKLARICNPTLERLGYERIDVDEEADDPETARRRYEFGLMFNRMKGSQE
ncbi:Sulfotransferase domain superfamily protein [Enhygromyxa salina]|uniref:Sulfotransferase domain superfamily protein n=1 Tax=Enhygromyxa salina TaxID=215803 RepID=A0A0C2CT63_9BACT|nr:sulfotransferase [Enhygromyxa salina]KIG12795.1 Sulfotransferase domain superfamily protein [Enhygromyxa salina]